MKKLYVQESFKNKGKFVICIYPNKRLMNTEFDSESLAREVADEILYIYRKGYENGKRKVILNLSQLLEKD